MQDDAIHRFEHAVVEMFRILRVFSLTVGRGRIMRTVETQPKIADVIEAVLADTDLKLYEIAEAANLRPAQIGRWRSGASIPSRRKVAHTLERLGIDPAKYGLQASSLSPLQAAQAVQAMPSTDERLARIEAQLVTLDAKLDHVLRALAHPRFNR